MTIQRANPSPAPLQGGPPDVPLGLVEYLEAVWPDRFPDAILGADPHAIAADMHRQAGRLEVIRFLRQHAGRQATARSRQPGSAEIP